MAGHSKWANIRHRKGTQDKKRSKIFTRIAKEITISARIGGDNIDSNPRLRRAVSNAKSNNMASDKIERAIKKGIGDVMGAVYEEIIYEGYTPGGAAIIVNAITDNKNRSVADIRYIFNKYNGNLGENGSVTWMFDTKGQITVASNSHNENKIFEELIELGAEDFIEFDELYVVRTSSSDLMRIRDSMEAIGYSIMSAEIEMVPINLQKLNQSDSDLTIKLLNCLEDNEDVNKVYTNFDYS